MAKYEKTISGQFEEILHHLEDDIGSSGITMNLVDESNYNYGHTNIAVRVYDKYFMRNGNRASLSLTVVVQVVIFLFLQLVLVEEKVLFLTSVSVLKMTWWQ